MSMAIVDVRKIRPIDHGEAMELATIGYERLLSLVDDLEADDWERSTDCEAWTIKDIVSHLLGEAEAFASMREFVHQFRISSREARASAIQPADAMNALQVRERSHLSPAELVGRLKATAPRSVRKRRRTPRLMRTMPMKLPVVGKDSYGYLSDVIITRDVWMHHIDITRAASKALEVTADYDGRLIADVVADWGRRHGRAFRLDLEGPAGGTYVQDGADEQEEHQLDAVEFCRILSGRLAGTGLLTYPALF